MAQGVMTPLPQAAQAVALVEGGYSRVKAAKMVGLATQTVDDIINGNAGWDERKNLPVFRKYQDEEKARLAHALTQLSKETAVHAAKVLEKASFLQAVTGIGIMVEKVQLLTGQPTSITETLNIHAVGSLDTLLDKFRQAAEIKKQAEIDVTPVDK